MDDLATLLELLIGFCFVRKFGRKAMTMLFPAAFLVGSASGMFGLAYASASSGNPIPLFMVFVLTLLCWDGFCQLCSYELQSDYKPTCAPAGEDDDDEPSVDDVRSDLQRITDLLSDGNSYAEALDECLRLSDRLNGYDEAKLTEQRWMDWEANHAAKAA